MNPALRIGVQLREAWRAHAQGTEAECIRAVRAALRNVSLPDDDEFLRRRPSQLSVGQGQRVMIAMAILHRPALLIADEATSALDTITQSEILLFCAPQPGNEHGHPVYFTRSTIRGFSLPSSCHSPRWHDRCTAGKTAPKTLAPRQPLRPDRDHLETPPREDSPSFAFLQRLSQCGPELPDHRS